MKKKTILTTGTSGFIGNFFIKSALENGYRIIDILREKNKTNKNLISLRKKYPSSYETIFFSNSDIIHKKLKNKKIDYFINFATFYKNDHSHREIKKFIDSNIVFPTIVLDLISLKVKKVINFGTMMQHNDGKNYLPKNFYASTKSAFEMISNFYILQNKKMKFYNIKFYESFGRFDNRKKLIPLLLKNFKKNIVTKIISNRLELNIIHVHDIINAVYKLLSSNTPSGSYCLKQKKNIKINNLIKEINKNSKKNLKVKFNSNKLIKPNKCNLKILPNWKPEYNIQKKIIKIFLNETN